jgi:hypothetical protein
MTDAEAAIASMRELLQSFTEQLDALALAVTPPAPIAPPAPARPSRMTVSALAEQLAQGRDAKARARQSR